MLVQIRYTTDRVWANIRIAESSEHTHSEFTGSLFDDATHVFVGFRLFSSSYVAANLFRFDHASVYHCVK